MAYQELTDFNTSGGIHTIFQYVASVEPIFFPLTLFVIFLIASLGSYFAKKEITGRANLKAHLAAASFITTLVAYTFSLFEGVVNNFTVLICLAGTILFTLLLFLPKDR